MLKAAKMIRSIINKIRGAHHGENEDNLTGNFLKKSLTFVIAITISGSTYCQHSSGTITPPWYTESLIHTHHSAGSAAPEWELQFDRVRPDAVQFHVSAYNDGKVLSEKYNFAFVATFNRSGHWDDVKAIIEALPAEEQELFRWRINPDGSPAGRMRNGAVTKHLCYYSPGIDKHIVPLYENITEQYGPDQFWIDHTIVTVNLCYCDYCISNFSARYGAAPPENAADPFWDEWVTYHREGFEGWMEKINHAVKTKNPSTLVTFNHAYFINQPEPPPAYIGNLSADIHSGLMNNCLFARYASSVGKPFDLMPGLTNTWAGTIPKTSLEVKQTAAIITANGGRWNIGEFPMSQDRQPADKMLELAEAGASLIKERKDWVHRTEAVPLVAILQSASTQYSRVIPESQYIYDAPGPTRIYWNDNLAIPNEIFGMGAALLENNIPFDIINEATLKERLEEYKLLIVGDQFRLDEGTILAIQNFVEAGGGLLATGRTIESGLADLLGVRLLSGTPSNENIISLDNNNISLQNPLQIEMNGAEVLHYFSGTSAKPAITRHTAAEGNILYMAGDFFKTYMDVSPYNPKSNSRVANNIMRKALGSWVTDICPDLGFYCTTEPWIEVASRRKGNDLLIQFVERTFEWSNDLYYTQTPVVLKMVQQTYPENVLLQPGNRRVNWNWFDDTLFINFPLNEIKTHSILEIKESFGYDFKHDTISNIPFGTRVDTLYRRLGKDPSAKWTITFVDGKLRSDLKTGDMLIMNLEDNSSKEYYLELNEHVKSSNAGLGAII